MRRVLGFFSAALRGPAGGMLACVLLAAMLGGIAMANPDALKTGDDAGAGRGGASHGGGTAIASGRGEDRDGDGGDDADASDQPHPGVDAHTVEDCLAIVAHLEEDVVTGNHEGLAQAIDVVSRNCSRHTEAPGLLRALERLAENAERFAARHGDGPGSSGDPQGDERRRDPNDGSSPGGGPSAGTTGPHPGANGQGDAQSGGTPQPGANAQGGGPSQGSGAGNGQSPA